MQLVETENIQIITNTDDELFATLCVLSLLGFTIDGGSPEEYVRQYGQYKVLNIHNRLSFRSVGGNPKARADIPFIFQFSELQKALRYLCGLKEDVVIAKITKYYNATITHEGIKVGCQTVSFEKFKELAAAVEKFQA